MIDADSAQRHYLGATEVLAATMPEALQIYAGLVSAKADGRPVDEEELQQARELVRTTCWAMSAMVASFEALVSASELLLSESASRA